ncbi:uncharacterized protein LOC144180097 [Haemaphysalis longicornis]
MQAAIQFTVEEEVNCKLSFLAVLVKRIGPKLFFSVYRKPGHTGRYLHFTSEHPASHNRSVVITLLQRAKRTCTEQNDLAIDYRDLGACGYPPSFLSSVERQLSSTVLHSAPSRPKRAPVPYVPGISETLSRIMRTGGVQIAHVPTRKLKEALVNVKDKRSYFQVAVPAEALPEELVHGEAAAPAVVELQR